MKKTSVNTVPLNNKHNMVDECNSVTDKEMNQTGDVDSTAAIVVQSRTKPTLSSSIDNDDTSTIATAISSSTVLPYASSTATQSKSSSSNNPALIKLPPLKPVRYSLMSLLVRQDEDNDEVHTDEKKQDESTSSSFQNTVEVDVTHNWSSDLKETTQLVTSQNEDNATTGSTMDIHATERCITMDTVSNAVITGETKSADDSAVVDSIQSEKINTSNAETKQKSRRDLFMMIHKEIQNPHRKPRPPLPLRTKEDSIKLDTVSQDVDSIDPNGPLSELEKSGAKQQSNTEKRRGRPPGQTNKQKISNVQDQVAPKRVKRPVVVAKVDTSEDIGKPIAPLYAYELFSRDYLRAYLAANKAAAGMTSDALNAITLSEWKSMSDQSKKPYVTRATQDQQIYHQQVKLWEKKTNEDNQTSIDHNPPPRERPKLVKNSGEANVDMDVQMNTVDSTLSPRPRGRPKFGHVWDAQSGQWLKNSKTSTSNSIDPADGGDSSVGGEEVKMSMDQPKVVFKKSKAGSNTATVIKKNILNNDDDDRWYTKLQSTPTSIDPDDVDVQPQEQQKPVARSVGNVTHNAAPIVRRQNILNPKRPPKINQDGSYRKPGGPQPVGYNWNAEYGYWESVVASDANLQRILDFDHDEAEEEKLMSKPQVRRQTTGSAPTMAQRKRKYTEDGCIVPRQTLERLPDGTYARPMGRPIVGYGWDGARGVWVPSSQMEQHQSSTTVGVPQHVYRRKVSGASAGNKSRLYTSDGCILPMKTPTKAGDGTFVRPFGRSIVGYTWDYQRGVWAPTGDPIPTKNAMPLPPSHFTGPIRLADKLVEDGRKYIACMKCNSCCRKVNCGTCLHCRILENATTKDAVPYLVCSSRICIEPVLNPKYTARKTSIRTVPSEESALNIDDDVDNYDDDFDDDQWQNTHTVEKEHTRDGNDDIGDDDSILESLSGNEGDDNDMMTDLEND